ncbi:assimilatory sulfite reductase (NADPH) flavoprotein subunit [Aciduricibacillus chroicocephali]|uniref:Assimilatory sulfite reductase (NADPH) flavoprotein subunit n=1 Tax=Aciduricibacillus chroicocephali TaxID=3054939 RepID=A0ABY9KWC8_9BACI|nr:assimilatory sulfite reductase (NADPH) flavoprotein subunit [Bacillaceae bacterium 44XB]
MRLQVTNSPFSQEQVDFLNKILPGLTGEQRFWLSGYLTAAPFEGLAEAGAALQTVPAPQALVPVATKEITVLYGTQTGNSQGLAEQFSQQLEERAFDVKTSSMSDFKPRDLKKLSNLIIIVSTHGEGDPPDDTLQFHEFLKGKRAPKLEELNYSVLALGDSSYEFFCQTGKEFDERLEELGASKLAPRVDCDLDFDEPAAEWFAAVLGKLEEQSGGAVGRPVVGEANLGTPAISSYSRTNPFQAEVLENINLNGRGSNKENHHIELSLEGSGLTFEPGDSIGIYPKNDPVLVDELIAEFGWDPETPISIKANEPECSLRDALLSHYEITVVTKPLLQKIAELTSNEEIKLLLEAEDDSELREYIYGRDLLDVIRNYSLQSIPADKLTSILRKMPARLYSIASSYQANPDEVHLIIGTVRYEAHDRDRSGVCSVHVADRIETGETLPIYVQKNNNFRLPENPDTPIIMVGPGTGIAPFRSFMEEREEIGAGGDSWLFFGDQHFVTDFLYQVEWQNWLKDGVLTKLDLAFSRDGDEKVYVQHRMKENSKEFYDWLERGAVLYICGDEEHMAHDVHQTLLEIVEKEGGKTPEEAAEYVSNLQAEKRYLRDVY